MRAFFYIGCTAIGMAICYTGCQTAQTKQKHAFTDIQKAQSEKEQKGAEQEAPSTLSEHYTHLKPLAWLIGTWEDVDEADGVRIETVNDWETSRNFIIQDFKVQRGDQEEMSGQQIIGWDPHLKVLRSWIFDTDGGFAEGLWHQNEGNWVLEVIATLPDGRRGSATYLFSKITPDSYTWEANDRQVGDDILEDIEPIEIKRKK